ncbi:MAG: hypothetical protein NTV86_13105 [Planctomycetota bacterium]|nr:hypothetical protein [Planctomycetota bacterium]
MTTANLQSDGRGVRYVAPTLEVYLQSPEAARNGEEPAFSSVEGLDDWWTPQRLEWGINGRTTTLTMRRQLGFGPGRGVQEYPETAAAQIGPAHRVRLVQGMAGTGPVELFRGLVGRVEMRIETAPDREALEVTAYGPEARLARTTIGGAWYKTAAADDKALAGELVDGQATRAATFATHLPAVFNPSGKPNASADSPLWTLSESSSSGVEAACKVFEDPGRVVCIGGQTPWKATHWTAWTALRSVVEYWDNGQTISLEGTNWQAIRTLLCDRYGQEYPIESVNVTGMDLLEAMRAILGPLGFGFAIEPWSGEDNRHRLLVFSLHKASALKRPPMATLRVGGRVSSDSAEGRRAQVQRVDFVRDYRDVRNEVLVVGDQIRRRVVLEFHSDVEGRDLHPAWDAAASENDLAHYADSDCVGGQGYGDWASSDAKASFQSRFGRWPDKTNRHVFRTFVWNEDGAWSHVVTDGSGRPRIPDLGDYGLDGQVVRRARPVGPSLEYADPDGGQGRTGAYVEIAIDGDQTSWLRLPGDAVRILRDRAGVSIVANPIETWCPFAAAGGSLADDYGHYTYLTLLYNTLRNAGTKLRLRLTGSIACDECVTGLAERSDQSPWPLRSRSVVFLPDRFKRRDVAGSPLPGYDVADDSQAADAYALCLRGAGENAAAGGVLTLRGLHRTYAPGDGVDRTSGRAVSLTIDGTQGGKGSSAAPIVVGVVWLLAGEAGKTQLVLDSPRAGRTA